MNPKAVLLAFVLVIAVLVGATFFIDWAVDAETDTLHTVLLVMILVFVLFK